MRKLAKMPARYLRTQVCVHWWGFFCAWPEGSWLGFRAQHLFRRPSGGMTGPLVIVLQASAWAGLATWFARRGKRTFVKVMRVLLAAVAPFLVTAATLVLVGRLGLPGLPSLFGQPENDWTVLLFYGLVSIPLAPFTVIGFGLSYLPAFIFNRLTRWGLFVFPCALFVAIIAEYVIHL